MKVSMLIGLIFLSFFSSCGRPKNFTQTAALNFSGAYATFANNYNLGVVINARKDDGMSVRRFWIGRNTDEVVTRSHIQPGAWTVYGIGFHRTGSPEWGAATTTIHCVKVTKRLQDGDNDVTLTFVPCTSENDYLYGNTSGKLALGQKCSILNRLDCYL